MRRAFLCRFVTTGLLAVVVGGCAAPGSREGVIAESAGLMAR